MKSLVTPAALALALTLGFATSAHANVPYVDCGAHDAPVLTLLATQGLIAEGVVSREVRLFANGDVQVQAKTLVRNGEESRLVTETYDSLWSETPDVMAKIAAAVQELRRGKLVDADPKAPMLMDGPGYSYLACQNGAQVDFARLSNGHEFLPKDARQAKAARYLRADLQNLLKAVLAQKP